MINQKLVKPELPGGFRDYLPKEQIRRIEIVRIIENVYRSFGFLPLDTPEVEKWRVLVGDTEHSDMRIYRLNLSGSTTDESKDSLALRFDLTVPLARVVAAYGNDLPKPFKRYQLGRVFRGETSQKGRFNGFYQFDIDTVFSSSMLADAEVIAIIWSTFQALGIGNISIKVNNRKILNGLAEIVGVSEKANYLFQILDRVGNLGLDGVATELMIKPENEWHESALALNLTQVALVTDFLTMAESKDSIALVEEFFTGRTEIGINGINELREVVHLATSMAVPSDKVITDLSVARGLGYYTGPVFETVLLDLPTIGSVFSGGRFDGLVGRFANTSVPATGASIGVDRLYAALEELELLSNFAGRVTQVLITVFDPIYIKEYLELANELRSQGTTTEVYMGDERAFKAQMAYALTQDIPVIVIAGSREFESGKWQVKDLRTRKQTEVPRADVPRHISSLL